MKILRVTRHFAKFSTSHQMKEGGGFVNLQLIPIISFLDIEKFCLGLDDIIKAFTLKK